MLPHVLKTGPSREEVASPQVVIPVLARERVMTSQTGHYSQKFVGKINVALFSHVLAATEISADVHKDFVRIMEYVILQLLTVVHVGLLTSLSITLQCQSLGKTLAELTGTAQRDLNCEHELFVFTQNVM